MARQSSSTRNPGQNRSSTERIIDLARATQLAIAGATTRQIAGELGCDDETVRKTLMSPEGQRALRHAVNDLHERTDRFLASAHLQALRRLVKEMEEAPRAGDRINAARAITSLATRRIEISAVDAGDTEVSNAAASLDARIDRMRERSRDIIDTTATQADVDDSPPLKAVK
jgi:hypothetical protein